MTEIEQQTQRALIVFCSLSMVQGDAYTHFLGRFKHLEKQKFNDLIRASDMFVKTIKTNLDAESLKAVEQMTDYMHNFVYTLIKGDEYIEIPTK
jgi:hypothetical protein